MKKTDLYDIYILLFQTIYFMSKQCTDITTRNLQMLAYPSNRRYFDYTPSDTT